MPQVTDNGGSAEKIIVVVAPAAAPGSASETTSAPPIPINGDPVMPIEYGFYPPSRSIYQCQGSNCAVASSVVIDSAVNNPSVGDERAFLAGSLNGAPVKSKLAIKPGDIVTVRVYVDDNADSRLLGRAKSLAQNVRVSILIPGTTRNFFHLIGFITTDNGSPSSINDSMLLVGQQTLKLAYVPGSAHYTHVSGSEQVSDPLSDRIVTQLGVGFGNLEPGTSSAFFITLQVRITTA